MKKSLIIFICVFFGLCQLHSQDFNLSLRVGNTYSTGKMINPANFQSRELIGDPGKPSFSFSFLGKIWEKLHLGMEVGHLSYETDFNFEQTGVPGVNIFNSRKFKGDLYRQQIYATLGPQFRFGSENFPFYLGGGVGVFYNYSNLIYPGFESTLTFSPFENTFVTHNGIQAYEPHSVLGGSINFSFAPKLNSKVGLVLDIRSYFNSAGNPYSYNEIPPVRFNSLALSFGMNYKI
jgi:hypothetical protein